MSEGAFKQLKNNTWNFPESIKIPKQIPICSGCEQGKKPSRSFKDSSSHAKENFELIHSDLKEFLVLLYHKYKYFIVFLDDRLGFMHLINLKKKSDTIVAMKHYEAYVRIQQQKTIKRWCFDAGGEFKSFQVTEWLKQTGIIIETSVPHQHQQNGCAKHAIWTIVEKAQTVHFTACLPASWWEFTTDHAVHLINCTPMKWLDWKTLLEIGTGVIPDFTEYKVFGCAAYVYLPEEV